METNATPLTERTHVEPDRSAMAELYARYVPAGIRLAYLMTGNRHQAEDLAQEASIRSHAAFDAYLRRAIARPWRSVRTATRSPGRSTSPPDRELST